MKVIHASVDNFGSYKYLEFLFFERGLTLISGPTGAGKSTLCDVIPWILFGITSKNGRADDVRSWNAEGDTKGVLGLMANGKTFEVVRIRGKSNDLYYYLSGHGTEQFRGKDMNDTQKMLNAELGLTPDFYLAGAYLHEFSETAQFFTASAKTRRDLTEKLADLSLAVKLTDTIKDYKKDLKLELEGLDKELLIAEDRHKRALDQSRTNQKKVLAWKTAKKEKLKDLENKFENFEDIKRKSINKLNIAISIENENIQSLRNLMDNRQKDIPNYIKEIERLSFLIEECDKVRCQECNSPKEGEKKIRLVRDHQRFQGELTAMRTDVNHCQRDLKRAENILKGYFDSLENEMGRRNDYLDQIKELSKEKCPFEVEDVDSALAITIEDLKADIQTVKIELADLELLLTVVDEFRGLLIKNTVHNLEVNTNSLLSQFFDAELRVSFEMAGSDKLEVTVYKDGNMASYVQLSKGQRQLLKLCFGVSVMQQTANHNGVSFNAIFLDEFADGLDEDMKVKAFYLVSSLTQRYDSVFCIDHSETLKAMFDNRVEISLVNGESQIG